MQNKVLNRNKGANKNIVSQEELDFFKKSFAMHNEKKSAINTSVTSGQKFSCGAFARRIAIHGLEIVREKIDMWIFNLKQKEK